MKTSMKQKLSAACLLGLLVPSGAFATVYIDHFSAPAGGQALTLTGAGMASSYTSSLGTSTLSGSRYLEINKTASSGGSHAVDINNTAYPSLMADSLESGAVGFSRLIWDGNGNNTIDYTMSPVDLTEGGLNSAIDIRIVSNDKPGKITMNFGDGVTNKDYTVTLPDYTSTFPTNFLIPFTAWTGVDFTNIRGSGLLLDLMASEDIRIDYIATGGAGAPVPEPSTFILLGAGIAGAAFMRRRAKNNKPLVSC